MKYNKGYLKHKTAMSQLLPSAVLLGDLYWPIKRWHGRCWKEMSWYGQLGWQSIEVYLCIHLAWWIKHWWLYKSAAKCVCSLWLCMCAVRDFYSGTKIFNTPCLECWWNHCIGHLWKISHKRMFLPLLQGQSFTLDFDWCRLPNLPLDLVPTGPSSWTIVLFIMMK